MRNLTARDGRALVRELNLFGSSRIQIKSFQVRDFLDKDSHGAHEEP